MTREHLEEIEGVTVLGLAETEESIRRALRLHFVWSLRKSSPLGALRFPRRSWRSRRSSPNHREDLLEIILAPFDDELTVIFWPDDTPIAIRCARAAACTALDRFGHLPYLVIGSDSAWILTEQDDRILARGSTIAPDRSSALHRVAAITMGLAVGATAMFAAWIEYGYASPADSFWLFLLNPFARHSLFVGVLAGVMAGAVSFRLLRQQSPSVWPRPAQLTMGLLITSLVSLSVALFLAKAYDFHVRNLPPGGH